MNPYEDLTRTQSLDWLSGLPAPVRPGLLDAMSFEDTEIALSRLFGGLLPAAGSRPVVTGPGGAPVARPGDVPPVRFGHHPRPNRTGQEPLAPTESAAVDPQWTASEASPDGLPVTRLGRGAATLADVLRVATDVPSPDGKSPVPSVVDSGTRAEADEVSWHEPPPRAAIEHQELDGPGDDASGAVHHEPGGHHPALVTPARLVSTGAPDDPWTEQEALADLVLARLRDEVELEFQRTYGLGEG